MIFGFAPGGSGDLAARLLADVATRTLGQHVVMENRTGANGMIAAEAIAKSAPDGHSVLYCTTGNMTIITELPGTKLAVNPATELVGLSQMLRSTFGLVVGKDSPWKTTKDIIEAARAKPGTVSYASPGVGSVQHLSGELLSQKTGIKMIHVPYRGSQAAIQDLASGRTGFSITNLGDTIPHIRQGTLRLIALGDPLGRQFLPRCADDRRRPCRASRPMPGSASAVRSACRRRWSSAGRKRSRPSVEDPRVSKKLLDNGMVPAFADSAALNKTMEENRRGYPRGDPRRGHPRPS